ncbi:hypothetical protein BDR06DRAFT_1010610 [Suillus hirtellus]|nr:hypothetical protein BDR06DRAFT_1010610 [Suillus hirtellus]
MSASSSSSTQYGGYAPSAQPPPPSAQPAPHSNVLSSTSYGSYVHHPGPSTLPHYMPSTHPSAPTPHHIQTPVSHSHPGQSQLYPPLNHEDGGMDYDDNDNVHITGSCVMADYGKNIMDLNSPPRHQSTNKCQLLPFTLSPSITPPPHTKFKLPKKPQMMQRNSHTAFATPDPMRHMSGGSLKPLSGVGSLHSWSTPTLMPSVMMLTTPTSQSMGSEIGKGWLSKKTCSDILSQVGTITNEIGSIKSEKLSQVSHDVFLDR